MVTLTDQAALAVALARARATAAGRPAHVVDLLIGLAEEPDGVAGRRLAEQVSAVVALAAHALPPRLAPLDVTVSWAVAKAAPRPAGTGDLLGAAREAGGTDLVDTLAAVGLSLPDRSPDSEEWGWNDPRWGRLLDFWGCNHAPGPASETLGLRPPTDPDPGLTSEAARAVAVTRAVAGGAVDLLVAVSANTVHLTQAAIGDPVMTIAALVALLERGERERAGDDWDRGLAVVLDAAHTFRANAPVSADDLVRAAAVVGGTGPALVLQELEDRFRG